VGLTNLGSESKSCVGSRVHLVGASISFEKNFYRLPFTPPSLVRRIGPSDMRFIYVVACWPSSAHDSRILNHALANFLSFPVPPKGTHILIPSS
jgi:hypothetical protein